MNGLRGTAAVTRHFSILLGQASLLTLASTMGAQAQMQGAVSEQVPEQVLVTGSLIRGTVAVGAPVTTLGTSDLANTGAVSIGQLLTTQPVFANYTADSAASGGYSYAIQSINIHGLFAQSAADHNPHPD